MRNRLGIALAAVLLTGDVEAGVRRIWAVNDGEKIERDARNHPLARRNSAWDGQGIRLFGARNEIVAFQVIVEADADGVRELSVRLPALASPRDRITYQLPAADPTDYVGRPIQIFAAHYMDITTSSHASWVYARGTAAAPADPTGWKPVQLVPEHARTGCGGLPVSIRSNENQAIWIEVYIDRTRAPGLYRGTIEIRADAARRTVPIELEVLDFALPDENSMHAMIFYSSDQPERYHGRNLDPAYHRLAHRHRVEFVHAYDEGTVQAAWGRFSGADFTREQKYEGPGAGVGNVLAPRSFYGPGREFDDRASAWARSDAWMTFLREKLPRALTFLYMPDEPRPPEYPRILALAENIHSNPGPGRALPIFVTSAYVEALDPAIDIWASGPKGFTLGRVASERARGRGYWFYNGGRPAGGAITIDAPATDARATIWAAFKHDVGVYFYWHGVHWRHNSQKQGDRDQNVWADSITFDNRRQEKRSPEDQGYIHGDGVLVYPGEERLHPDQDRGIPGPIATIQLANLRRGLQDHQYLTLARRLGLDALVSEVLTAIVPRVFSDAGERVSFPETGDPYETARLKLARAIAAAGRVRPPAAQDAQAPADSAVRYRSVVMERAASLTALRKELGGEAFSLVLKINRLDLDHVRQGDSLLVPELTSDLSVVSPFPRNVAMSSAPRLLVVSRRVQAFAAYEGGALVRWGPTSTGRKDTPTPEGLYHTNWRSKLRRSTDNDQWLLPWLVNFENERGISFHQFDLPGYPASHACVRLLEADARWIHDWAEPWFLSDDRRSVVAYGTPVVVFGEYAYGEAAPWKRLAEDPGAASVEPGELDSALAQHAPLIAERARQRADFLTPRTEQLPPLRRQNRRRRPNLTTRPTENPSLLPTVSASSTAVAPLSATPLIK